MAWVMTVTEEQIRDAHKALMAELFLICQPGNGDVFAFMDDHPEALRPALEAALRASPPIGEWRDISTAPKDGTEFLAAWGRKVVVTHWLDNSNTRIPWAGWKVPSMVAVSGQPTLWQPLPAPPSPVDGGRGQGKSSGPPEGWVPDTLWGSGGSE